MSKQIRIDLADLNLETLRSLRDDLSSYGHLALYREKFQAIIEEIQKREEAPK